MNQFEKAIQQEVTCDICGEAMHPMYGGGWDNDRIVCFNRTCGAEIEYPTSTIVDNDHMRNEVKSGESVCSANEGNTIMNIVEQVRIIEGASDWMPNAEVSR